MVTKLLEGKHRHSNRQITEFSNKKRSSMEKYLEYTDVNICPLFLN